ncbi:hypothetical protein FPFC_012140 [Fructobacillus pseudoficulneus]|uniref:Glycosyltransferase RgtA/B/C/D-like domain-containing protein n=1 Tax=Fructobacillus pseudoficulneus TaxID=220714 RepID=A0A3F3GRN2_9LACO|nr:DUF6020 family protein [Fructobacillus pseudoficulneus]GAP02334.1 hypothetical protein FPFC_012140 [Fructobacillus pseudoficulneus]SEH36403.1 hypothetical protein SAMN05660469_0286 [Fructobacillus pseudoficulneus]
MIKNMKNIINNINVVQWVSLITISLILSFFNSFALSVLNDGGWGTMNGTFTVRHLLLFIILFVLFSVASIFLIFVSRSFSSEKNEFKSGFFIKISTYFESPLKTALFLIIFWGVLLLPFFPVVSGWDIVGSMHEVIDTRSADFAKNIFNIYPIANYLTDGSTTMWTNQHGAFLTAFYGLTIKYSWIITKSYLPGYLFLGLFHFSFAVYAYTKAIVFFQKNINNLIIKIVGLALIIFNPMIFLNTISLSKNPLFVSSFVLFFVLMFEIYRSNGAVSKSWMINMFTAVFIGVVAVKWALYVYAIIALIYLVIYRKVALKPVLISMFLPIFLLKISLMVLVHQGVVLQDDPIESKGIQIQQIARYVHDDPSVLTKSEYQELNKIFDMNNIGNLYSPAISDPVKSSGGGNFTDTSKLGYRYRTVKKSDWKNFNKIWLSVVKRNPQIAIDATVAQVGSYVVPSRIPLADYALTMPSDTIGHGYGSMTDAKWTYHLYHNKVRTKAIEMVFKLFNNKYVGYLLHGNFWIVVLLLMVPAFMTSFSRFTLVLPAALQIAISAMSPLANSERYTLGIVSVMPFVLMLMVFSNKKKETNG